MKPPPDPIDAAFAALRARASHSGGDSMVDEVMARVTAPGKPVFPFLPVLAAGTVCLIAAISSARALSARPEPDRPPSLTLFRADGTPGNPFSLP